MKKFLKCFNLGKITWFILLLLPLFCYMIALGKVDNLVFADYLLNFISSDNIVYTTLCDLFVDGNFGLNFLSDTMCLYFSYFVLIEILHICVDLFLLLIRILHKLIEKLGGYYDEDF